MGEQLCLVDTATKQTFSLREEAPEYIVSAAALQPDDCAAARLLIIPPSVQDQSYCIKIIREQPLSLQVVAGACAINGRSLVPATPLSLSPGAFISLGSRSLQCVCPGTQQQAPRRVLPPTPGQALGRAPPSKPRRQKLQQQPSPQESQVGVSLARIECTSSANEADHGIRQRLQRIAAEVSARLLGYEGRKPPPPYEQVGNSIGYQILHQQKRDQVTSALIDALYPALKESELKDPSLHKSYSVYVEAFSAALEQPASLTCMLPADLPTCDFVVDMLLHLCCMPHMTALAEKQGDLWCQLLAVFSQSRQNQIHMASKRHPTKVLSCMHLKIMSCKLRFQQYGWTVLANTVPIPPAPPDGKPVLSEPSLTLALARKGEERQSKSKGRFPQHWLCKKRKVGETEQDLPVLSEPSLTLALSLCESQLATCCSDMSLVVAVVEFLAQVATTAKLSASQSEEEEGAYSVEQAMRILSLFQEKFVLRHVMKVPSHLRLNSSFEQAYSRLVKALVPVRGQLTGGMGVRGVTGGHGVEGGAVVHDVEGGSEKVTSGHCEEGGSEKVTGGHGEEGGSEKVTGGHGEEGGSEGVADGCDVEGGSEGVSDGHDVEGESEKVTGDHGEEGGSEGVADGCDVEGGSDGVSDGHDVEGRSEKVTGGHGVEGRSEKVTGGHGVEGGSEGVADGHGVEGRREGVADGHGVEGGSEGVADEHDVEGGSEKVTGVVEGGSEGVADGCGVERESEGVADNHNVEGRGVDGGSDAEEGVPDGQGGDKVEMGSSVRELCVGGDSQEVAEDGETVNGGMCRGEGVVGDPATAACDNLKCPSSDLTPAAISDVSVLSSSTPAAISGVSTLMPAAITNVPTPPSLTPAATSSGDQDTSLTSDDACASHATSLALESSTSNFPSQFNPSSHSTPSQKDPTSLPHDLPSNTHPDNEFMIDSTPSTCALPPNSSPGDKSSTCSIPSDKLASCALLPNSSPGDETSNSNSSPGDDSSDKLASCAFLPNSSPGDETNNSSDKLGSDDKPMLGFNEHPSDSTSVASTSLQHSTMASSPKLFPSSPTTTPPLTPTTATLAEDVEDLLSSLNTPLEACVVKVPSLSLRGRYYRHSFKKVSFKQKHSTLAYQENDTTPSENDISTSSRGQWGESGEQPSMIGQDNAALFEVSGVFLSSHHSAIEEVLAGHSDVLHTLQSRVELLKGVLTLWTSGKGLQAATNLLQGCFSEHSSDERMLFVETVRCFLSHQSSWTLAVCLVLLPPIHQLLTTQTHKQIIGVTSDAVLMIVNRFSELILACKVASPTRKRWRLSSSIDREQQLVCYKELHSIQQSLHARLNTNQDSLPVANKLRKVHAALIPFKRL